MHGASTSFETDSKIGMFDLARPNKRGDTFYNYIFAKNSYQLEKPAKEIGVCDKNGH